MILAGSVRKRFLLAPCGKRATSLNPTISQKNRESVRDAKLLAVSQRFIRDNYSHVINSSKRFL